MITNITVIIRSSEERTEQICKRGLEQQVPKENIFLIKERPFYRAVEKTFEIGILQNKKWTLAVDADLVLTKNAVKKMVSAAENKGSQLYVYQGYILDSLYNKYREGGPHLYQTLHLTEALKYLEKDSTVLRPESDTYLKMAKKGYIKFVDNQVFGVHDYYQYNSDLFRKGFFHAIKHKKHAEFFFKQWQRQLANNQELAIAFLGFSYGLTFTNEVDVDIEFLKEKRDKILSIYEIEEKKQLTNIDQLSLPENLIEDYEINNPLARNHLKVRKYPANKKVVNNKFLNYICSIKTSFGNKLEILGKKIQQF